MPTEPVTAEHLAWADIVFVMEGAQRRKLQRRYRPALKSARVICLNIADDYGVMDPELVRLLETRVTPHLRQIMMRESGIRFPENIMR